MAPILHDPVTQTNSATLTDEWDHAPVPATGNVLSGQVLPTKRVRRHAGQPAANIKSKAKFGVLIDIKSAARTAPQAEAPAAPPAAIHNSDDTVVKLEPLSEAGPFQANKVIPAMELTPQAAPLRLHGEGKDWGYARKHPLLWLLGGGLGVAASVIAALAVQELYLMQRQKLKAHPGAWLQVEKVEVAQRAEIDELSEESARTMVAAYATADTPAKVLPLIRDAERLASRLTHDWQPWNAPPTWQPARDAEWKVSAEGGKCHGLLSGLKPDFAKFRVCFVREGENLRIDWEATEGMGDTSFDALQRGVGSGGLVRAYIAPENFYSITYPDAQFCSFKMLAMDREQVIWGYARVGSPEAEAMLKVFAAKEFLGGMASAEQAMTVRLAPGLKGSQKNQWLIGELLHIDWVSP
jgi:hypothetical protein